METVVDEDRASYRDYELEARQLVKNAIEKSLKNFTEERKLAESTQSAAVEWPTGGNFTVAKCQEAINRLIQARDTNQYMTVTRNVPY